MVSVIEQLEAEILRNAQDISRLTEAVDVLKNAVEVGVSSLANYDKLLFGYTIITIGLGFLFFGLVFVILQRLGVISVRKKKPFGYDVKRSEVLTTQIQLKNSSPSVTQPPQINTNQVTPSVNSLVVQPQKVNEKRGLFGKKVKLTREEKKQLKLKKQMDNLQAQLNKNNPQQPVQIQPVVVSQQPIQTQNISNIQADIISEVVSEKVLPSTQKSEGNKVEVLIPSKEDIKKQKQIDELNEQIAKLKGEQK